MSSTHNPNAYRDRIAATRFARERAQGISSLAITYLRDITRACSSDGVRFEECLSQAIVCLPTVRNIVVELEALLPEIDAAWNGREPESSLSEFVAVSIEEEAK